MKRITITVLGLLLVSGAVWAESGFVVNGDGTVTQVREDLAPLVWLQDAGCLGELTWIDAEAAVAELASGGCDLTDDSAAGQWRQPSRDEWNSMLVALGMDCPEESSQDAGGEVCAAEAFFNGADAYWSSTSVEDREEKAWAVSVSESGWDWLEKESEESKARSVWAVREQGQAQDASIE